jgi:enoyl-[acyl-carrier-protein] reductase (NADH)
MKRLVLLVLISLLVLVGVADAATELNDPSQAGSVLVFPRFVSGTFGNKPKTRITVNVVCPGLTETPLLQSIRDQSERTAKVIEAVTRGIPLGRVGTPEEIADAVVFLASPSADFITGQTLSVSGGLTMQ